MLRIPKQGMLLGPFPQELSTSCEWSSYLQWRLVSENFVRQQISINLQLERVSSSFSFKPDFPFLPKRSRDTISAILYQTRKFINLLPKNMLRPLIYAGVSPLLFRQLSFIALVHASPIAYSDKNFADI